MAASENDDPIVAVRPPAYWPSPATMALADAADRVLLADTLQYSRQSFQNRAQIRTPQGWQWLTIPLKGGQHGRPIYEVEIRHKHFWMGKHWRALEFNYRRTPYFEFYEPLLKPVFDRRWERLGALTCRSIELLAELLGIETPIMRASEVPSRPATVPDILESSGTQRLLTASDTLEVDIAFAPTVEVLEMETLQYRQNFDGFEPGMSALDLLFNYGPESLTMIRRCAAVHPAPVSDGLG